MAIFTEEKYREILEARERLRKYRDKIQPYPLLPKYVPPEYRPPEPEESKPQVVEHIVRHASLSQQEYDLLQQTSLKADYLEKRLNELSKKRPSNKYVIEHSKENPPPSPTPPTPPYPPPY